MAKKHRWDKSTTNVWPLNCLDCGCTGRVKEGTAGTMQYLPKGETTWRPRLACETQASKGLVSAPVPLAAADALYELFRACCGGTDENPPNHTADCD